MLLQSLGHFKGLLYRDSGVIIDDIAFKLHYDATSYCLLFASFLVTGKVYLGNPIQCTLSAYDFAKIIPADMLNSYCYIHSTFIIPDVTDPTLTAYPGLHAHTAQEAEDHGVVQSFYQWVPLMLFLQGLSFFLPKVVWSSLENGKVKGLRLQLNNPCLDAECASTNICRLVDYFKTNVGLHTLYGKHYLYSIFLNFLNLVLQIILTNYFLGGHFVTYGLTYTYESSTRVVKTQDILFPKMSRCHLHMFGPSGTKQLMDGLCVLPLNILHDKIYLVLWYWYLILLIVSTLSVFYWALHFLNKNYRLKHIERHLKGTARGNELKPFNSTFGDWFLLHQMYKNIEHAQFIKLISKLCGVDEVALIKRNPTHITFHLEED